MTTTIHDNARSQPALHVNSTHTKPADRFAKEASSFDDVLLLPDYKETLPCEVNLSTRLHVRLVSKIPVRSAAMDTVTESELAIALALQSGLGVNHRNLSVTDQSEEVDKVKRSQSGMTV